MSSANINSLLALPVPHITTSVAPLTFASWNFLIIAGTTWEDISIAGLARIVQSVTGYKGKIVFDSSKPDGMPQKLMDVSKLADAGWTYKTELQDGLELTYKWYLENYSKFNGGDING